MTDLLTAAKLALEALKNIATHSVCRDARHEADKVIPAFLDAIEAAERAEPVAWMDAENPELIDTVSHFAEDIPLYRHPAPAQGKQLADVIASKNAEIDASGIRVWEYANADQQRYQRLRILGAAPCGHECLTNGTVLRFQTLDEWIDADIHRYDRDNPKCMAGMAVPYNEIEGDE